MTNDSKISILVVGANGRLGREIVKASLQNPKLLVSALVRNPTKIQDLGAKIEAQGGKVIQGDVSDPQSLIGVTKGFHTVVSCLRSHDDKVMVDGQIALAKDGLENELSRFVPTDFVCDFHSRITREELQQSPLLYSKILVDDYLKTTPLKVLKFYTGVFSSSMIDILSQDQSYWGDSDHKIDLTSYEDTGKVVAAALIRPELSGRIHYAADTLTIKEIQDTYNKVRGTNIQLQRAGSLEDYNKLGEVKKKEGDMIWLFIKLLLFVYDDRSTFTETNNKDFPEVKTSTFEEFLKLNPEVEFNRNNKL